MLVWELSLKGCLGQDSPVFDDFGDPSGAFEDLGSSLQHSNLEPLEFRLTGMAKRVSWRRPESILELTLDHFKNVVMT